MARLKVPAIYQLDIGSSEWGWFKMEELTLAVNNLIERSPLPHPVSRRDIGNGFVHLNKRKGGLMWSNGADIFEDTDRPINWEFDPIFIPAQWGLNVLEAFKRKIPATDDVAQEILVSAQKRRSR
jgi:hypothetical protein